MHDMFSHIIEISVTQLRIKSMYKKHRPFITNEYQLFGELLSTQTFDCNIERTMMCLCVITSMCVWSCFLHRVIHHLSLYQCNVTGSNAVFS